MRLAWDEPLAGTSQVRDEDRALFGSREPVEAREGGQSRPVEPAVPGGGVLSRPFGPPTPLPDASRQASAVQPFDLRPPEGTMPNSKESPRDIAARIVGRKLPVEGSVAAPPVLKPPFPTRPPASRPYRPMAASGAAPSPSESTILAHRPSMTAGRPLATPAATPRSTLGPRPLPPRFRLPSLNTPPPTPTRSPLTAAPPEAFPRAMDGATAGGAPPEGGPGTHVVQRGETLFSIGRTFGISPVRLARHNAIEDPDLLRPGLTLRIPSEDNAIRPTVRRPSPGPGEGAPAAAPRAIATPRPVPSSPAPRPTPARQQHRLGKGETLWAVAKRYGVALKDLMETNRLVGLSSLEEGLVIEIPLPPRKATSARASSPRATTAPGPRSRPTPRPRPPVSAGSTLQAWPMEGRLVRRFGWHDGRPSTGIGIEGTAGQLVRAAAPGKVIYSATMRNYGKVVILAHADDVFSVYGNCALLLVSKGTKDRPTLVSTGQALARIGGGTSPEGKELHFEVRMRNKAVDPLLHLPPRSGK